MSWTPSLVIFDCDGVLVDSEPIGNRYIAEAISELGLPMSQKEALSRFLGGKLSRLRLNLEAEMGIELGDEWVDAIYEKQFKAFREELEIIPGIVEVLDALEAAGVTYCIGSNGPLKKMEVSLGVTNLYDRVDGRIYSADMVADPKPAPDLYLHCAEQFELAPERCAVIEDSPTGVRAGVAAGMRVFGYGADSGEDALAEAGAHVTFSDMTRLPGLLSLG